MHEIPPGDFKTCSPSCCSRLGFEACTIRSVGLTRVCRGAGAGGLSGTRGWLGSLTEETGFTGSVARWAKRAVGRPGKVLAVVGVTGRMGGCCGPGDGDTKPSRGACRTTIFTTPELFTAEDGTVRNKRQRRGSILKDNYFR